MMNQITDALAELDGRGFAHVALSGVPQDDLASLEQALKTIGKPIHVFRRHPFWKELGVDLSRDPGRSGGIGFNSLHIDCVNVEYPPDVLVLYCVMPDPLGGGANLLAVTDGLENHLSEGDLEVLRSHALHEGASYDLDHVGTDINPFTVLHEGPCRWRYTGRLLESDSDYPIHALNALVRLDRALLNRSQAILLEAGEALFVDQRRVLHGRLPLGDGQEGLRPDERRMLVQGYGRYAYG